MPLLDFFTSGAGVVDAFAAAAGFAADAATAGVAGLAGAAGVAGVVWACAIRPEKASNAVMSELFSIVVLSVTWQKCHATTTPCGRGG